MTPQKIVTKLNKIEKVELAKIQDLVFSAKTAKATIQNAVDFLKEADPLVQAAANRITEYENWIDITLKEFRKINQDAKDLGISPKEIKGYKEAEDFLSKSKQLKSTYDGLNKMIKSNRR
tara:strand:- start:84 stop:443 length:360 start_codon:yes stop_codon:yes gene_type:complete